MTTEFVLILGLYAFVFGGVFFGKHGPIETFKKSAPRLAARMERDISVGKGFTNGSTKEKTLQWLNPDR